jgi:hypothetical protein
MALVITTQLLYIRPFGEGCGMYIWTFDFSKVSNGFSEISGVNMCNVKKVLFIDTTCRSDAY